MPTFQPPSSIRVVWSGQSLLLDIPDLSDAQTVPLMASAPKGWSWGSIAVSGLGYALLLALYSDELAFQARNDANTDVLVMALSGQGDLADLFDATPTAQDCYDAWVAYAAAGRAAGFDYVVATTIPPLSDSVLTTYGFDPPSVGETKRQAINTLVLADVDEAFDLKINVESIASQPPDEGDATFPDGVHLSIAGRKAYADAIAGPLATLLA